MELTTPNSPAKSPEKAIIATIKAIRKPRQKRIEAPHISEICEGMLGLFGGVEGFCKKYHGQITEAIARQPGSRQVLESFARITSLVEASTRMRMTAPDVFDMSDEELEREIQYQVVKVINQKETDLLEHEELSEPV